MTFPFSFRRLRLPIYLLNLPHLSLSDPLPSLPSHITVYVSPQPHSASFSDVSRLRLTLVFEIHGVLVVHVLHAVLGSSFGQLKRKVKRKLLTGVVNGHVQLRSGHSGNNDPEKRIRKGSEYGVVTWTGLQQTNFLHLLFAERLASVTLLKPIQRALKYHTEPWPQ